MKSPLIRLLTAAATCALTVVTAHAGTGIATRPNGEAKWTSPVQAPVFNKNVKPNPRLKNRVIAKDALDASIDPKTRNAARSRTKDVDVAQGVRITNRSLTFVTVRSVTSTEKRVHRIGATLANTAKDADQSVTWRISRSDDQKEWTPFFQNSVVVPGGGKLGVRFEAQSSAAPLVAKYYKIDVISPKGYLFATETLVWHNR
jgi:hypothetical protein